MEIEVRAVGSVQTAQIYIGHLAVLGILVIDGIHMTC
jgi:hypothetical protein